MHDPDDTLVVVQDDYRRYLTAVNERDWATVAAFVVPPVRVNSRLVGRDGYVEGLRQLAETHPDHQWELEEMIGESNRLAVRLTTTRARRHGFELALYRWDDRQIAEVWTLGTQAAGDF